MHFLQQHRTTIIVFSLGILIAVAFIVFPFLKTAIGGIGGLGYFGSFILGILYSGTLTSATATVILLEKAPSLHPFLIGIVGGIGAMLFDAIFFVIGRKESEHGWLARTLVKLRERRHVPNWFSMVVGGIILASPLPDELAAGLLGVTHTKVLPFLALSFFCNAIGIFLVSSVAITSG
ncbi:MAG: hypothetical protein V1907_01480 [Candidatus Kerfeldbacteria bacterium]